MWMRIRAVPTGHLNKNLQMRSFLFKFHFSHTWLPSPKLKNVMNKQRRKIFGGNIMRFKFSGTSNQDQKCSSGSNVRLLCNIIQNHSLWSNQNPYPNVKATITGVIFRCPLFASVFHCLYINMEWGKVVCSRLL